MSRELPTIGVRGIEKVENIRSKFKDLVDFVNSLEYIAVNNNLQEKQTEIGYYLGRVTGALKEIMFLLKVELSTEKQQKG